MTGVGLILLNSRRLFAIQYSLTELLTASMAEKATTFRFLLDLLGSSNYYSGYLTMKSIETDYRPEGFPKFSIFLGCNLDTLIFCSFSSLTHATETEFAARSIYLDLLGLAQTLFSFSSSLPSLLFIVYCLCCDHVGCMNIKKYKIDYTFEPGGSICLLDSMMCYIHG